MLVVWVDTLLLIVGARSRHGSPVLHGSSLPECKFHPFNMCFFVNLGSILHGASTCLQFSLGSWVPVLSLNLVISCFSHLFSFQWCQQYFKRGTTLPNLCPPWPLSNAPALLPGCIVAVIQGRLVSQSLLVLKSEEQCSSLLDPVGS